MNLVMPVLLLAFMAATALAGDISKDVGFTPAEQQNMIDLHNHYRARVARGEERNQPQAADMIAMEWDDRLMNSAQKWSSTCRGWHNKNEERRFKPYPYTGQNYAGMMGMTESVRAWYNEVTEGNFGFHGFQCSGVCGHYTQVVWGKAHLLGCAQNKCKSYGEDKGNVYCEYAPGGNTQFKMKKDPVYTVGKPCSKCPQGFSFCMSGSLCASSRACKNSDSKCECTIKSCKNGGTLDKANCQCKCPAAFEGPSCETPCEDKIDFCDGYSAECAWNANMWMWMGRECRKFCKKCGGVKDPGYTNSGGIKTNAKDMSSEINCNNGANDASCAMWMDQCVSNPDYMKKECARACGFCKSQFVKVKPPPKPKNAIGHYRPSSTGAPGVCINIRDDKACEYWEKQGECDRIETQMRKFCAKACGFCDGLNQKDNKNERHLVPSRNCYDERSSRACDFWKKKGECEHAVHHMRRYCAKTCNLCDEKPQGDDGGLCTNKYQPDSSCEGWAKSGECQSNPSWMKENCAAACGCPGSTGGSNCKNKKQTKSCESWASKGECKRIPDWMKENCAAACRCPGSGQGGNSGSTTGTTGGSTGGSTSTGQSGQCSNIESSAKCDGWAKNNECSHNPGYMYKNCAKSCGCPGSNNGGGSCSNINPDSDCSGWAATAKPGSGIYSACRNARDDRYCRYWSDRNACSNNRDLMLKECQRTCGFCGVNDGQGQTCKNYLDNGACDKWYQGGLCKKLPHTMEIYCKKTCDMCHKSAKPAAEYSNLSTCRNELGDTICERYKATGECLRMRHKMNKFCQKSCGVCLLGQKALLEDKGCLNSRGDIYCNYWSRKGRCGRDDVMRLDCKKACGFCTNEISDSDQYCEDRQSAIVCNTWVQSKMCNMNMDFMKRHCRRSCQFCDTKPPTQPSFEWIKGDTTGCFDQRGHEYCSYWAQRGQCNITPDDMRRHCRKTCDFCPGTGVLRPDPEDRATDCVDERKGRACHFWLQSGECKKRPEIMVKYCRRTCGLCGGNVVTNQGDRVTPTVIEYTPEPVTEVVTTDRDCFNDRGDDSCMTWKSQGHCKNSPELMKSYCRKECGFCRTTVTVRPTDPTPIVVRSTRISEVIEEVCINARGDESCRSWKSQGYCEKTSNLMESYCRKECSFCGTSEETTEEEMTPMKVQVTERTPTNYYEECSNERGAASCRAWKRQGHCENSRDLMQSYCRKECGFCTSTATDRVETDRGTEETTSTSDRGDTTCANERGDQSCRDWKAQGHCENSPQLMKSYCRLTCGYCKTGVTSNEVPTDTGTPSKVVDRSCYNEKTDENCRSWKAQGHCQNSPDLMRSYCQKECNFCGTATDVNRGTDRVETTDRTWDRTTERYRPTVTQSTNVVTETVECVNEKDDSSCRAWASQGHCENSKDLMRSYCFKECGFCKPIRTGTERETDRERVTTQPDVNVAETVCVNAQGDASCRSWKAQGHCENSPQVMQSYCKRECGFCQSAEREREQVTRPVTVRPDIRPTGNSAECINVRGDDSCRSWKSQGHCENNADLMRNYCMLECGYCTATSNTRRPETARPETVRPETVTPEKPEPTYVTDQACTNAKDDDSCQAWKAQGHCEKSRDLMRDYCHKSCGFCTVGTTEPTRVKPETEPTRRRPDEVCVNAKDDVSCREWASSGHCKSSEGLMRLHCARECRFCGDNAVPQTKESSACVNQRPDADCRAWKFQHYCESHRKLMLKYCKDTCGFCDENRISMIVEPEVSNIVSTYVKITKGNREVTVRTYITPSTTLLENTEECVNTKEDQSCRGWKSQGYCETSQDLMREYCARECRFCGEATETSRETQPGREETNPTETSGACVNSRDDASCRAWRSTGYCESQEQLMRDYCPLECGFCGGTRTTEYTREKTQRPTAETRACVNTRTIESCRSWKAQGYCESSTDLMRDYCARECGLCDERVRTTEYTRETTERPDVQTRACVNTKDTDSCRAWRAQGYCETSRDLMRQYCARECQFCEQEGDATTREPYSRESTRTTETEVGCVDTKDIESCRSWKAQGYCETSQELMQDYCASTCEFCGGRQPTRETYPRETTAETESTDCVNTREEQSCRAWKSQGYCESSVDLMRQYCARECGFCSGRQTPRETYTREPTRTIAGQDCVDTKEYEACRSWKSQGYCETSQELMRDYCQRTCGFCDGRSVESTRETYNQTRIDTRPSETEECVNTKELAACRNWKSEGYCESSPELMAEYCRKECNFCGAETFENIVDKVERPTTQATSTCVNERDENSCRSWKAQGYCDTQRDLMSQYCALTCGLCGEVRRENIDRTTQETRTQPTGRASCENTRLDALCEDWRDKRYCQNLPDLMRNFCPKTCGFCGEIYSEVSPKQNEANDTVAENRNATAQVVTLEPATESPVAVTKIRAEECVNSKDDQACRAWKALGYCENSQDLMRDYCKKECNFCDSAGLATEDPRPSIANAGVPEEVQTIQQIACFNEKTDESCRAWKSQGYCESSAELMREYCSRECGFCRGGYAVTEETQRVTEDNRRVTEYHRETSACRNTKEDESCRSWKQQGYCETSQELMRSYCALECGLCEAGSVTDAPRETYTYQGRADTQQPTAETHAGCVNTKDTDSCQAWKSQGYCDSSQDLMRDYCALTCGFCGEARPFQPTRETDTYETQRPEARGACINTKDLDSCQAWKSQGHCERSRDLMRDYCALECGLCDGEPQRVPETTRRTEVSTRGQTGREEVTPGVDVPVYNTQPPRECFNEKGDEMCGAWVSQGHCERSPELMEEYCRKSCSLCKTKDTAKATREPRRIPEETFTNIVDIDDNQSIGACTNARDDAECRTWKSQGHCEQSPERMRGYCRKECGFCSETESEIPVESETESETVTESGAGGIDERYPTDEECTNAKDDEACRNWSDQGYCETSPELMKEYCAKECNLCSDDDGSGDMEDGEFQIVTREPVPDIFSVPIDRRPTYNGVCENQLGDYYCRTWASQGHCQTSVYLMKVYCLLECNLCETTSTRRPKVTSVEVDIQQECENAQDDVACESWASTGYCTNNKELMNKYCRKTCNFCADASIRTVLTSNQPEDTGNWSCYDLRSESECKEWRDQGHCQSSRDLMRSYCRETCQLCGEKLDASEVGPSDRPIETAEVTEPTPVMIEDSACVNRQGDTDCAAWKAQGRCESSAESMRDYCAKACGFCRGVLSGTDEPVLETSAEAVNETCVDARPQETCEYWKSEGYCSSSRDQMYDTCRKTCELCEVQPAVKPGNGQAETEPPKEKTTTSPFPDPAENELPEECFNKQDDRTCRQWREAGHCESSAGHMLLYCRRECRFCGDAEDHLIPATTAAPQRRDPKETCFDKEGEEYCTYWQSRGECIQNRAAMLVDCRKSCRFCYPNTIGIRTGIVKNGTEILPSKTDKNIDSEILPSLSKDHTATDPTEIAPTKESTVETNIESESVDSEIKVETVNTENELREDKDMTALPIPSPEEIHILDETAEIEEKLHELEDRLQEIEKQENKSVA